MKKCLSNKYWWNCLRLYSDGGKVGGWGGSNIGCAISIVGEKQVEEVETMRHKLQ